MPSRKKAKGKARKAAKKAEAKEEGSRAVGEVVASQRQVQEEKLEALMEQVIISDPSPTLCRHGYPPLSAGDEKICLELSTHSLSLQYHKPTWGKVSAQQPKLQQKNIMTCMLPRWT